MTLPRPRPSRRRPPALAAFLLAVAATAAGAPEPRAADLELPVWDLSASVSAAAGHRDNVLFSSVQREGSPFFETTADVLLWRLPTEQWEFLAYVYAQDTRYTASATNPFEQLAFVQCDGKLWLGEAWRLGLDLRGTYQNQVIDLSANEVTRTVARYKVTTGEARPTLRWQAARHLWLAAEGGVQREMFRGVAEDSWERRGGLRLGWEFARDSSVAVAASASGKRYDEREQLSLAGREIAGTQLRLGGRDVSAEVRWAPGDWQLRVEGGWRTSRDNGSGYLDHDRRRVAAGVTWRRAPWRLSLSGSHARFDYPHQTVGIGLEPPRRVREDMAAEARAEWEWTPVWTLFAAGNFDRVRSNEARLVTVDGRPEIVLGDHYNVTTLQLGLQWQP